MTTINRRSFLAAGGAATLTIATGLGTGAFAAPGVPLDGDVLVSLHLSGGADGLSLTPPLRDPAYYDLRPNIAIPAPGEANGALPLQANGTVSFSFGFDGAFGLHPAARAIHDGLWADGKLAIVPGAGFRGATASHFTATRNHNRGSLSLLTGGGWLGRLSNGQGGPGPLPLVDNGGGSTSGGLGRIRAIPSLDQFRGGVFRSDWRDALNASYAGADAVAGSGRFLLGVADRLGSLEGGIRDGYPDTGWGRHFSELGSVLKADPTLGVRAASLRLGRWDHHENLGVPGNTDAAFHTHVRQMSDALQAFADDTNGLDGIVVVITTEFGRTTNENGNQGTDHGQAYTMMVAGGAIKGGVYGDDFADSLALPSGRRRGSVPIMTDFRKPIAEVIRKRVKLADTSAAFPDFVQEGPDLGIA
ncbi:MAG: DUF1501 domain-containing protein [Actinomycetota bacterium]